MKIKWGALVTDGRGKIGGHVASKNRSGAYLRTKVTPVNPQTSAQSAVRSSFGAISQAWSGLTLVLILAWNGAVADWQTTDIFGDLKKPTGKNLFLRLNQQLVTSGQAQITAPPAKLEMVEGVADTPLFDLTNLELSLLNKYAGANANIVLYATPPMSQGTTFVKNKLRQIYSALGTGYSLTDAYSAYVAKFGTPSAGANVYVGVKYVLPNGQASPLQTIKASVEVV